MQISTTVVLDADDNFAYSPDAGALQVLTALGGNATSDYSVLYIQQNAAGTAGTAPAANVEEA